MDGKSNLKEINSRLKLFISLGFAIFFGLLNTIPFLIARNWDIVNAWHINLFWVVLYSTFWMIVINIIWSLEFKHSIINKKVSKVLFIHLAMLLGVIVINTILSTIQLFDFLIGQKIKVSLFAFYINRFINNIPIVVLLYSAIWGIGVGLNYYQKFQERAIRASELETQLAHSQLQTLKAQLQPHFLFNTLNGIVGLIRNNDNQAAIETINELSALLRYVVENAGKEMIELKEELEFNQLFLSLHQKRFSDRMQVSMDIAPETLHLKVPNLILQPLVENAIVHGVSKSIAKQRIIIKSKIENNKLKLSVKNDASKLTDDWKVKKGVGLEITYSRLEKIYEDNFSFDIWNHENRCVIAEITLPIKKAQPISR